MKTNPVYELVVYKRRRFRMSITKLGRVQNVDDVLYPQRVFEHQEM